MTSLPWTTFYAQATSEALPPSIMSTYAMAMTILFTVFVFTFEHMLDHRQERTYKITKFPELLAETVDKIDKEKEASTKSSSATTTAASSETKEEKDKSEEKKEGKDVDTDKPILPQLKEKFIKAQNYGTDKIEFGMFSSVYNLFETVIFLLAGFLPYTWDISVKVGEKYFEYNETDHEIKITLIFLLITTIIGTITALPFELVSFKRMKFSNLLFLNDDHSSQT